MALGIGIGVFVVAAAVAIAVATTRYLRQPRSEWPAALVARRERLRDRVRAMAVGDAPWRLPALSVADAEAAMAAHPDAPDRHVDLAVALLDADELDGAADALARARSLGATGPAVDYVAARVRLTAILRQTNATNAEVLQSPIPSLITPFEMFVLQLERQRQQSDRAASVWLAGMGNETLGHDRILAVVTEHFGSYYDVLDGLVRAAEAQPGFGEALYHAARVALKVGFIAEGRALLDRIEPLLAGTGARQYYDRDMAQLRDDTVAAQVSDMPAIGASARRSPKLKVL
jgi:hypothetical protein